MRSLFVSYTHELKYNRAPSDHCFSGPEKSIHSRHTTFCLFTLHNDPDDTWIPLQCTQLSPQCFTPAELLPLLPRSSLSNLHTSAGNLGPKNLDSKYCSPPKSRRAGLKQISSQLKCTEHHCLSAAVEASWNCFLAKHHI